MNKKRFTFLAALLITVSVLGQSPEKMSYQAVVRDASNATVANQVVGMQISILQTTAEGIAVYVETQAPTTNASGLLSIYVGAGTLVTGVFSDIDWSALPHYIKIEIDPTGNANYTITGTTQLVSVPFALYAKTAGDNVLKENTANKSTNVVTDAASDVKFPSVKSVKTYVDAVQDNVDALDVRITAIEPQAGMPGAIGDTYLGGIIFYLDPTGYHGLICAPTDQGTALWWNGSNQDTRAYGSGLFEGKYNTPMINIKQGGGTTSAAAICALYDGGLIDWYSGSAGTTGLNDWYLPSIEELKLMYLNIGQGNALGLGNIGGFAEVYYWSSTELTPTLAWFIGMHNGKTFGYYKNFTFYVRPVRSF